jgi:hypothetical protein
MAASEISSLLTTVRRMATIWTTNGDIGPGSTGPGTDLPLELIDERLAKHKMIFLGEVPTRIAPHTIYFTHVVVHVSGIDELTARFDRPGYYRVLGLQADDAEFLTAPPPGTVFG